MTRAPGLSGSGSAVQVTQHELGGSLEQGDERVECPVGSNVGAIGREGKQVAKRG